MTLAAFQAALADFTASPGLCRQVREAPATVRDRYDVTDKEWRRLVGIAASRGMEANCMLYRANRLAPVALNLPRTCAALGEALNPLISAYWESEPTTDVNFLVETERFCRFLEGRSDLPSAARPLLTREHAIVAAKLAASRRMAGGRTPAREVPRAGGDVRGASPG